MTLDNFEKNADKKILYRGLSYYESNAIVELEQVGVREYSAIVMGSEEYAVFISLDEKNRIVDHECDCPYDWGSYCKHEIAVLYYLKNNEAGLTKKIATGKVDQIKNEIVNRSKEELEELLLDVVKKNKTARDKIYWSLGFED